MDVTTTTDMERLLARDEPGLYMALTKPCFYALLPVGGEDECPDYNEDGRVPLAPDSAHVALERWWVQSKVGRAIRVVNNRGRILYSAIDHDGTNQQWYDGETVAGAVNAALEGTK